MTKAAVDTKGRAPTDSLPAFPSLWLGSDDRAQAQSQATRNSYRQGGGGESRLKLNRLWQSWSGNKNVGEFFPQLFRDLGTGGG